MIRVGQIAREYFDAGAMSSLIGLFGFIDEHTFLTKSGDLGVVFRVPGVDAECLDHAERDHAARRFEGAIRALDERFRVYQYLLKRDHPLIPHRHYENAVVEQAISNRLSFLNGKSGDLYTLDIFYVLMYEGWHLASASQSKLRALVNRPKEAIPEMLSGRKVLAVAEDDLERARELLANKAGSLVIQLQDTLGIERLNKSATFAFFRRLLNFAPYKLHTKLRYDRHLDYFACDSMLECYRDHLRMDGYFVQVLTLKEAPAQTFAHVLRALEEIPSNYAIANEWKRESNLAVRKEINSKRRHFHNSKASLTNYIGDRPLNAQEMLIDDGAAGLVADLGGCLREIEITGNYFGKFSLTIVLYDRDHARLRRSVAECFKVLSTHDAVLIEERYNLLNAFLSVIPGNRSYNLRRVWLLNTNYADLSFLFTLHTGETHNAHLDHEYLAVLETNSSTPYFLNLHYQDVAHTMILGATGSGKSFFLNFLITNLQKYQPLTYIFDLGGSYESLTRLFDGSYLRVGIEHRSFTINPFRLPLTKENLHFLFSFVKVLIESGGYAMTSREERDLFDQIGNLYEVDPDQRRLFTLANILSRSLAEHLHKWVEGGQYGALFDNVEDNLTFAAFQTFDFEGMDKYPQVLEPLLFYVLHRANASIYDPALDIRFKVFVMDEAWRFLKNDTIRRYITEAVKTWRKRNAAMVLATQSSDDLERSEMLSVIVESCATKMFLANPGMDRDAYRETFHLNETEAGLIASLVPKQQILIKRPDFSKVVNLNVDPIGYWLYTSNPYDSQRRREAFERYGFARGLEQLTRSNS
ncbi:MAG TPA: type IV secretion system DNA-binding domain-containing protein [Candidatus Polarisedimenticolia bacterium]|nr:type IV secretion system DNA-binding domain-containing protein [Candidatus Polarisedimenticolia bacterium]